MRKRSAKTSKNVKTHVGTIYSQYFPSGKSECICRSGLRFKRCCKSGLEDLFAGRVREESLEGVAATLTERMRRARLKFSRYWLWHTAHRAQTNETLYAPLVDIDIRAMAEMLESLMCLAHEAGEKEAFLGTLDRLRGAIADKRWPDRISFLRALCHLYPNWSESAQARARDELKDVDAERLDDVGFLQVYYTLFADSFGLNARLRWLERLERESSEPGQKLQYAAGRAMLLVLHKDPDGGREELAEALRKYEASGGAKDNYGLMQYGHALIYAAQMEIQQVERPLEKADEVFRRVALSGELNDAGLADVERWRGRAHATAGRWPDALEAYKCSQSYQFSPQTAIYLAEAFAHLERISEARAILYSLDYESLSLDLKYDFCLYWALSLGANARSEDVNLLSSRLKELEVPHPALVEQLRHIQDRLQQLQRSELEAEIERLRSQLANARPLSSDESIRTAIAMHRALPPSRQTATLPMSEDLPYFLAKIVVHACAQLLDQRQVLATDAQSQEDTYTAYLMSLLQQRVAEFGWSASDQRLGGLPSKDSPERGRRDLAFWKGGDVPFGIVEALRCSSMGNTGKASVDEHLSRLVSRYDACGSATSLLIIYAEVADFSEFCNKYVEHIATARLPTAPLESGPSVLIQWKSDGLVRRNLVLLATAHRVGGDEVAVTHMLLHLPSR